MIRIETPEDRADMFELREALIEGSRCQEAEFLMQLQQMNPDLRPVDGMSVEHWRELRSRYWHARADIPQRVTHGEMSEAEGRSLLLAAENALAEATVGHPFGGIRRMINKVERAMLRYEQECGSDG